MGCGDEKLSKYLTQTFTAHCNAMICQQVMLSGDAEWPKVADAVIEAHFCTGASGGRPRSTLAPPASGRTSPGVCTRTSRCAAARSRAHRSQGCSGAALLV